MPYEAEYLFKAATGSFPTSGQGLKANGTTWVGSGDKAKEDHLIGPMVSGDWPTGAYGYARRHTFGVAHIQGDLAHHIKSTGNIVTIANVTPGGAGVTVHDSDIVAADNGSTMTIDVHSGLTPNGSVNNVRGHPDGYDYPDLPPETEDPWLIRFFARASSTETDSVVVEYDIQHVADGGPFNPTLSKHIAATYSDMIDDESIEAEWYATGDYGNPSDLVSSAREFTVMQDFVGQDITYYLRYRLFGSGSWTNYGGVTWTDVRGEV